MNWITFFAIYGAILSTLIGIWTIYYNFLDRPRIKIIAKFGFISPAEKTTEDILFIVTAINKGRRPITLSSMGLRLEGNVDLLNIKTIGLPVELGEGKSHLEWFNVKELKNKHGLVAWYMDQTRKMYRSKSIKKKLDTYFKRI